jgi:ketosteroid isomerase-like protein
MTRQDADLEQQSHALRREQERQAALVRTTYATLARGDIAALAPALAAQAIAHEYDETHHCATYQGRRAILARLEALAPSYWDAVHVRVHTVAAAGPLIAAIATWQGTSRLTGRTYAARHVLVARIADDQFVEVWLIRDGPTLFAEPQ